MSLDLFVGVNCLAAMFTDLAPTARGMPLGHMYPVVGAVGALAFVGRAWGRTLALGALGTFLVAEVLMEDSWLLHRGGTLLAAFGTAFCLLYAVRVVGENGTWIARWGRLSAAAGVVLALALLDSLTRFPGRAMVMAPGVCTVGTLAVSSFLLARGRTVGVAIGVVGLIPFLCSPVWEPLGTLAFVFGALLCGLAPPMLRFMREEVG